MSPVGGFKDRATRVVRAPRAPCAGPSHAHQAGLTVAGQSEPMRSARSADSAPEPLAYRDRKGHDDCLL